MSGLISQAARPGLSIPARTPIDGAGIRVTDDLPRPLPVLLEEGDIVRKLLGERFREILLDDGDDE